MKISVFSPKAELFVAVILLLFAACNNDTAGPSPVITSFYATSGVVGAPVIIVGDQFIPTVPPEQGTGPFTNTSIVTFNGTVAEANSVYQDSVGAQHIIATVPQGATTGKIAITANGFTVSSSDDFIVTIPVYLPNVEVTTMSEWGTDVAMDSAGNLYATHKDWHEIIKVTPDGTPHAFWSSAINEYPVGIAVDLAGNVYATVNLVYVLKISPGGEATSLAGGTVPGYADGQGVSARFSMAFGIDSDKDGNLYVADLLNYKIRKITTNGTVSTLAGSSRGHKDDAGANAQFESPQDLALDVEGNVFVTDGNRIRKITSTGVVSTIAGSVPGYLDGTTTNARFRDLHGIVADPAGNLYTCDLGNYVVRRIATDGTVATVAGSTYGFQDGPGSTAQFVGLLGATMDANGVLHVAQSDGSIRKIVIQ